MSKTLIIILVVGVAVLLLGGVAWAKHRGYCRMGGPERMVEHVSQHLNLEQNQQAKLETFGNSLSDLRDQWRQKRQQRTTDLLSLLDSPTLDRDKATTLLEQRHLDWRERGVQLVEQLAEFTDSLTEEQRATLRTLIQERFNRSWHGHAWSN